MSGPKRSPSARTGERGEAIVEGHLASFAVCNRLPRDFGDDLLCHLDDGGSIKNPFLVQVKTQRSPTRSVRIRLKMSTVRHWAASPIPVFLIVCILEPRPSFLWRQAIPTLIEQYGPLETCFELTEVTLRFDRKYFSDEKIFYSLPYSVRDVTNKFDESLKAVIALGKLPRRPIRNEKVPAELTSLNTTVGTYYAMSKETRAEFIERFISVWEKIEYRLQWGYPILVARIALLICHVKALKAGLKSLYYMESDVISIVSDDLVSISKTMTYDARLNALIDSLAEFHRTPYVQNPNFNDILARKINTIVCRLFGESEVVPSIVKALSILRERFPIRRGVYPKGPNAIDAAETALNYLREFKEVGTVIPAMAADWFEREMALSTGWSWESKVHIISYHHLHERRLPRAFDQMTEEARRLIFDGMGHHPYPLVRLDCLKVYGKDELNWLPAILDYTHERLSTETDAAEIERLKKVQKMLISYGSKMHSL